MKKIFKEPEFKAATIDWLYAKGYLHSDSVLINELPVSNFKRRADLVVANGKLHAFEIKSDSDSLERLEGQVETYLKYFDKVSVVCSSKFTKKVLQVLPDNVEIVELSALNCKPKLTVKRRGKIKPISYASHFLSFVDKKTLISILRSKNLTCHVGETRTELYKKISNLPKSYWRNAVIEHLKFKYSKTFSEFNEKKSIETTIHDLRFLKLNRNNNLLEDKLAMDDDVWDETNKKLSPEVGTDISERLARIGFVPNGPVKVIPRKAI